MYNHKHAIKDDILWLWLTNVSTQLLPITSSWLLAKFQFVQLRLIDRRSNDLVSRIAFEAMHPKIFLRENKPPSSGFYSQNYMGIIKVKMRFLTGYMPNPISQPREGLCDHQSSGCLAGLRGS
ncbi:hypothetical protein V2G26_012650 [Clonostachys chloroleuca]